MMTRGKRIAAFRASEQTTDASREPDEGVGEAVATENSQEAKSGKLDPVLVGEDDHCAAKPAVKEPVTPAMEINEAASGDIHKDEGDNVAASNAPVAPIDTDTKDADESAPPASSDKTVAEAAPGSDTILKTTMEKHVDQVVDTALTPPSDMPKGYGDDLPTSLPVAKPISSGVETPETTVADQITSPVEAQAMEIDGLVSSRLEWS